MLHMLSLSKDFFSIIRLLYAWLIITAPSSVGQCILLNVMLDAECSCVRNICKAERPPSNLVYKQTVLFRAALSRTICVLYVLNSACQSVCDCTDWIQILNISDIYLKWFSAIV